MFIIHYYLYTYRASASGRERTGRKGSKSGLKDRDWILRKKERMKRQGKQVKTDSKYSGRKRSSGF